MEYDKKISAFIKKIRARLFGQVIIDTLLISLAVGFFTCLILSVISMLVPFYYAFIYMAVSMLIFFVVGIILAFKNRPSMEMAALKADSKGCKEKIVTAYDLKERDDAFSLLQKTDAWRVIDNYDIKDNFRFSFKPKRWIVFICLAALFAASTFVETDARRDASYKHDIAEKVKEEISEIEKIEKAINENENISETEAAEILEELESTKKELLEAESYEDIQKAWDKEKLKLADAVASDAAENNEALSNILSEALEENTARKNEELEELIKETEEALENAKDGSNAEKEEASDKLSELASALGSSSLSSAAEEFAASDKTSSDVSAASSALSEALSSMNSTSYASSEGSESSLSSSSSSSSENNSEGSNSSSSSSGSSESGSSSEGGSGSSSSGNSEGTGSSGTGSSGGTGSNTGEGTGGGWNKGDSSGSEGSSKTAEDVTIPDGETGNDENLTGEGNDNDSSTYEKSDEALTWSGNKVSYGQVSSEYKEKAYNTIESSSYPEAMKEKIKTYFDSLN